MRWTAMKSAPDETSGDVVGDLQGNRLGCQMAGDAPALQFSKLLETRALLGIRSKQRLPADDSRALRFEKRAQFRCEK